MSKTRIEWADMTINPIIGCSKCSQGCDNCYAERFATRLAKNPATRERYSHVVADGKWNGRSHADFSCFDHLPKKPARIFVGSMGDSFHENILHAVIHEIISLARRDQRHTFMFLTKRPERMRDAILQHGAIENIWLGVTVCNQDEADEKIPILLSTPAAKRFVSIEPMLGKINLRWKNYFSSSPREYREYLERKGRIDQHESLKLLDWVICGGETGHGARQMNPDWARLMRDHCREAGTPFFFKQMTGKESIPYDLMIREIPA